MTATGKWSTTAATAAPPAITAREPCTCITTRWSPPDRSHHAAALVDQRGDGRLSQQHRVPDIGRETRVSLLDQTGVLLLTHNWFKPGWVSTFGTLDGTIHDDGTAVTGTSPGFVDVAGQDFPLTAGFELRSTPQLRWPRRFSRSTRGPAIRQTPVQRGPAERRTLDIGAYEYSSAAVSQCDLNRIRTSTSWTSRASSISSLGSPLRPPGVGDLNHDGFV